MTSKIWSTTSSSGEVGARKGGAPAHIASVLPGRYLRQGSRDGRIARTGTSQP